MRPRHSRKSRSKLPAGSRYQTLGSSASGPTVRGGRSPAAHDLVRGDVALLGAGVAKLFEQDALAAQRFRDQARQGDDVAVERLVVLGQPVVNAIGVHGEEVIVRREQVGAEAVIVGGDGG